MSDLGYTQLARIVKKANTGLDAIKRAPIVDYDSGVRCLRIQDISQRKTFNSWGFCRVNDRDRERFLLKKADLLIARTGATIGANLIINRDIESVFNNGLIRLKTDEKQCDPIYLAYNIGSACFASFIDNVARTTSTQPNIKIDVLLKFTFPLPEIRIQKRIAGILSAYDELIENNKRRIALLEKLAEEIYREWFVRLRLPGHEKAKFSKGIPADWTVKRFGEIANFTMGQSPPSEAYNESGDGMPFHQGVGTYGERFPRRVTYCTANGRKARKGDILFSVRAPVGRLNIADCEMIIGRGLAAIRHKEGYNSYLFYLLKVAFANEDIIGNGSIFNSVGKDELAKFRVLQPDDELIAKFQFVGEKIDEQIETLSKSVENLTRMREMLLPRLISGKLSVENLDIQFPPGMAEEVNTEPTATAHA